MTALAIILAVLIMGGLVWLGRLGDPDVPSRKHRPPGLPEDGGPLECWEWEEMDRIQACYRDTAHDPVTRKSAQRRGR